MLHNLIHDCIHFLDLSRKYEIILKDKTKKTHTAKYEALYNDHGKLVKHLITIYVGNIFKTPGERNIETLLAHEFVHAWQEEFGKEDIHGDSFIEMAGQLQNWLLELGYDNIGPIYCPETDN